jgi:hypothetical protein
MRSLWLSGVLVLTSAALVAPAHALSVTTPVLSGATFSSALSNISFKGFNSSNFFLPPGSFLTGARLTINGTAAGTFQVTQYSPLGPASVSTPGTFNLQVNSILPTAQTNANSTGSVPAATFTPSYTPGVANFNITSQPHTFNWAMYPGGTPGTALSYFTTATVTLPGKCSFVPTIGGTAGASQSADGCSFALDSTLANTYLTYDYDVPGPLPVVGAAAAFSWSRRLRRRVAQNS